MNQKDFFSTPEFQKQIIPELASDRESMSPETMLSKVMTINKELSKRNLNFSKEESSLLIQILKQSMSPSDQQKVDLLMGLFHR